MKDIFDLVARTCLALIFIFEAYDSVVYFKKTLHTMKVYGITWHSEVLLIGTICFLILGAILVLTGYYANLGSLLLMCYIVPVTFIVYSFWDDPKEVRHIHAIMFMKNIAIIGGLLLLLVHGAGKYSIKRLIYVLRLPE